MTGRLADNIALFGRVLRLAGLPLGPGAVLRAVEAVDAAGLARRDDLYWTLHSALVFRHEHSTVFDEAFSLFWRRRGLVEGLLPEPSAGEPGDALHTPPKPGSSRVHDAVRPREDETREVVEREGSARFTVSDLDLFRTRDFAQMSADEVARAKRLIGGLRLPDDARRSRRFRPDRRGGSIDLRATLRRSLRGGGAAIDLATRSPRTRPLPLVAIVDISGSMAEYSRLFLHFLHALAGKRRRVHSFVFATHLTNITRELAGRDPDEALARAAARVHDWEGGTRIAPALRDFNRHWSRRVLGGGAVVLLVTDGLEREVGSDLPFEMDRLHRSCGRLVWLNPLLRFTAFQAKASGIRAMLPHVDAFRPIHSLASMEELVRALADSREAESAPARWLAGAAS